MPTGVYERTEEMKKNMSRAKKGEKHPMFGRTGENNPLFGTKQSEEAKKKQSEAQRGKTVEERGHDPENCQCPICKGKRGENYIHPIDCPCMFCKVKRGETTGDKNPNWKGGLDDYWRKISRRVWEETHGKKIPKGMLCHHIDGNVRNIDPSNLELRTRSTHGRWHKTIKPLVDKVEAIIIK